MDDIVPGGPVDAVKAVKQPIGTMSCLFCHRKTSALTTSLWGHGIRPAGGSACVSLRVCRRWPASKPTIPPTHCQGMKILLRWAYDIPCTKTQKLLNRSIYIAKFVQGYFCGLLDRLPRTGGHKKARNATKCYRMAQGPLESLVAKCCSNSTKPDSFCCVRYINTPQNEEGPG